VNPRRAIVRRPSSSRLVATALLAAWWGASSAEEPSQPAASAPAPTDAAAPAPAPRSRADAYTEFRRLYEEKKYPEAVVPAQEVVDLTDLATPNGSEELQAALMNLATTQFHAGDHAGAEASYLRVIELIERSGRRLPPRLVRATAGLATTYHAAKRHDLAAERFAQAIALSRRTAGLFDEGQLPLLEKQAESLGALDRMSEALQARRYALRIVEHKYGAGSLRFARELESIGRWYARGGAYDASRQALRRAIGIVEAAEGENSRKLLGPLAAIAENARRRLLDPVQQEQMSGDAERRTLFHDPDTQVPASLAPGMFLAEGQQALERAVQIASTGADPVPDQVADTHTRLGDWLQWRDRDEQALQHYQQAWRAARDAQADGQPLMAALFGQPVLVHYVLPEAWDRYRKRPATEVELRHVEIELTVTAQGRAQDPAVVGDGGDPRLAEQALRAAATARYRPRMVDGQPVASSGVRFVQPFYVLIEKKPPEPAP
jgi:tetratricopeptide (TPR) repeat protein